MTAVAQGAAGIALALSLAMLGTRRAAHAIGLLVAQIVVVAIAALAMHDPFVAVALLCQAAIVWRLPRREINWPAASAPIFVVAAILAASAAIVPAGGLPLGVLLLGGLLLAVGRGAERQLLGIAAMQSGIVLAAVLARSDVWLLWLTALPWLPVLALAGDWLGRHRDHLSRLLAPRWANIAAAAGCVIALLLAVTLPWQSVSLAWPWRLNELTIHAVLLLTALAAAASWSDSDRNALWGGRLIVCAGTVLAMVSAVPALSWCGMLIAAIGAIGAALPDRVGAWRRLVPICIGLGLALFGIITLRAATPVPLTLMAIGYGATAMSAPELAIAAVVLLLRQRVGATSELLICLGLTALLLAAYGMLMRRDAQQRIAWFTLGGGGIALFAFGLGGDGDVAGLLQLTMLTLTLCVLLLARDGGLERLLGLAGAAGVPPIGLFPSLAMVIAVTAARSTWLLLPLGVGLAGTVWPLLAQLPAPRGLRVTLSPAWIPLLLLAITGCILPGPMLAWLRLIAAEAP